MATFLTYLPITLPKTAVLEENPLYRRTTFRENFLYVVTANTKWSFTSLQLLENAEKRWKTSNSVCFGQVPIALTVVLGQEGHHERGGVDNVQQIHGNAFVTLYNEAIWSELKHQRSLEESN